MDDVILNPGEVLDGKYEIVSMLGQGVMGVVYKARALTLNRDVAIKLLTHVDANTVKSFSAEAENLARIKHPTVVRIDNFGSSDTWGPYLVLSYIPGRDLDAVASAGLPLEEAVSLAMEICTGVFACHTRSVIHRDLKPSNVLVTNKTTWLERVKILDLGLALPFDSPILKARQLRMSQIGTVDGVSRYIAPELLRREKPSPRCDQYSIAALTYLLATGHAPFGDLEGDDLVRAIIMGKVLAPHLLCSNIPANLSTVILRGMHPDPNERFRNVREQGLAMIPFGPEVLKKKATRYFKDLERPIEIGLVVPFSADHAVGNDGMPPEAPASASAPAIPSRAASPDVPAADPAPWVPAPPPRMPRVAELPPRARKPTPAVAPVARKTPSKSHSGRRRSPWMESNAVVLFSLGAALGATIATVLFVAFFIYRQRHPEPLPPSLEQPSAQATPSPGSHGAH